MYLRVPRKSDEYWIDRLEWSEGRGGKRSRKRKVVWVVGVGSRETI